MQLYILELSNALNVGIQVGDAVYYAPTTILAGSNTSTISNIGSITQFGNVHAVYPDGVPAVIDPVTGAIVTPAIPPNSIEVVWDDTIPGLTPPAVDDYIMFGKDKRANSSSLIGYFAKASFVNDSTGKVELFSIGSEVSESSR